MCRTISQTYLPSAYSAKPKNTLLPYVTTPLPENNLTEAVSFDFFYRLYRLLQCTITKRPSKQLAKFQYYLLTFLLKPKWYLVVGNICFRIDFLCYWRPLVCLSFLLQICCRHVNNILPILCCSAGKCSLVLSSPIFFFFLEIAITSLNDNIIINIA